MFEQYKGGDFSQHTYTSDVVEGETLAGDGVTKNFNLDWTPVIPGSIDGSIGTDSVTDDGNGTIKINGSDAGTINYQTGTISFSTAPSDTVDLSYTYDNMSAPVKAPEIQLKLVTAPIQAKSRKLKALYAFDAAS